MTQVQWKNVQFLPVVYEEEERGREGGREGGRERERGREGERERETDREWYCVKSSSVYIHAYAYAYDLYMQSCNIRLSSFQVVLLCWLLR